MHHCVPAMALEMRDAADHLQYEDRGGKLIAVYYRAYVSGHDPSEVASELGIPAEEFATLLAEARGMREGF